MSRIIKFDGSNLYPHEATCTVCGLFTCTNRSCRGSDKPLRFEGKNSPTYAEILKSPDKKSGVIVPMLRGLKMVKEDLHFNPQTSVGQFD